MGRKIKYTTMNTDAIQNPRRVLYADGTWLDPEEMCSQRDSLGAGRRARVRCPDGKLRIVKVKLPDTYFTIPAVCEVKDGRRRVYIRGFVTGTDVAGSEQEDRRSEYGLVFVPTHAQGSGVAAWLYGSRWVGSDFPIPGGGEPGDPSLDERVH